MTTFRIGDRTVGRLGFGAMRLPTDGPDRATSIAVARRAVDLGVTIDELTAAREIVEITSVQNRYSVLDREHEPVLDACTEAGTAFLPWRPVAHAAESAELVAVAGELGATPAQVALAWLLHRSPVVLPIPGTASLDHLAENITAAELVLDDEHLRRLDAVSAG